MIKSGQTTYEEPRQYLKNEGLLQESTGKTQQKETVRDILSSFMINMELFQVNF